MLSRSRVQAIIEGIPLSNREVWRGKHQYVNWSSSATAAWQSFSSIWVSPPVNGMKNKNGNWQRIKKKIFKVWTRTLLRCWGSAWEEEFTLWWGCSKELLKEELDKISSQRRLNHIKILDVALFADVFRGVGSTARFDWWFSYWITA